VSPSPLLPWHTVLNVQHWQNHNQQRETEVRGEKICIRVTNLTRTAHEPHSVLHSEKLVTTWSQLYCTRQWQHFATTGKGDRLSCTDEWPSWTGACGTYRVTILNQRMCGAYRVTILNWCVWDLSSDHPEPAHVWGLSSDHPEPVCVGPIEWPSWTGACVGPIKWPSWSGACVGPIEWPSWTCACVGPIEWPSWTGACVGPIEWPSWTCACVGPIDWPSWTRACVGPIQTAPHNDGQQPRLKQSMNDTISGYMTCTEATAPMWILVPQLLWAPTEHLPCANHECLLGFHICGIFGLLHLRGISQQTKYLDMVYKPKRPSCEQLPWHPENLYLQHSLNVWPYDMNLFLMRKEHLPRSTFTRPKTSSQSHTNIQRWNQSILIAHSAVCNAASVEQDEHVTGCNFLALQGKQYYHTGNAVLNKKML